MTWKGDRLSVRFAGAGGQGLQAAAAILGESLVRSTDFFVCQAQNYGPESRGGLSYSDLIISRNEIDFPKIQIPDVLVLMSNESYLKFQRPIMDGSILRLIIDPDMVPVKQSAIRKISVQTHLISATLASEAIFGNRIAANVVLVGAIHAILQIGDQNVIEAVLRDKWPVLADKNVSAFRKGIDLATENLKI